MTAGLLAFSALAPVWATTVEDRRVQVSMVAASLGTLGVAAAPLGSSFGDGPHVAAAAVSYVAMALTPALGVRSFGAPRTSYALTALAAALLVGSTLGKYDGALQRAGLGVTDTWMAVQAVRQLRGTAARA